MQLAAVRLGLGLGLRARDPTLDDQNPALLWGTVVET